MTDILFENAALEHSSLAWDLRTCRYTMNGMVDQKATTSD